MVRIIYVNGSIDTDYSPKRNYAEISCLSTDTKPTIFAQGSIAVETDTGNVYFFDESSGEWVKQFSFQG